MGPPLPVLGLARRQAQKAFNVSQVEGIQEGAVVQEVVALSKAGVSDEVLVTLIERDKTIFAIDSDQLIALTRDRVSEKVVLAMLRNSLDETA